MADGSRVNGCDTNWNCQMESEKAVNECICFCRGSQGMLGIAGDTFYRYAAWQRVNT